MEAFEKVCEVLNMVHHVRCTEWHMLIPMVLWAYRTLYKTLTAQALSKPKYEAKVVIPMEGEKLSLCITAPIDTMVHNARKEGITQQQETEHIGLAEEIRRGNFRLRELEKERVRLRKKNDLMDVDIKKLEDEKKEAFLIEKHRMVRKGVYDHTDKF